MTHKAPCRVTGIHRLAISAPDLDEMSNFYRDVWLLEPAEPDSGYGMFDVAFNRDVLAVRSGRAGLDHLAFAVASETDLVSIGARLRNDGYDARPLAAAGLMRADGAGIVTLDPEGREIRLILPAREAEPGAVTADPRIPDRLGHIVLWTAAPERTEDFYSLLGLQVTDRTHIGMAFLRCNADHHTLAFVKNTGGKTGVQHIAFDVGTIDNVMRHFGRLRDLGHECVWGVGRHGPGNNVFSYYTDPAGNFVEYYGDMEKQPDGFPNEERYWGSEHRGDIWGVAGMPPLSFRQ